MAFKGYPERGCRNLAFNSRINYTSTSTCCMLRHADAPIKNPPDLTFEVQLQYPGGQDSLLRPALISSLVHRPYKHFKPPAALCFATSAGRLPDDWAVTYTVMADLNHGGRVSVGYLHVATETSPSINQSLCTSCSPPT
ncbi:hypothetical protein PCL_07453 [Purpureocillium lilacinum]|uniref:Uncharacterized protein n=1 Tax=Purpureocillium lilacinum TaxID=33203 RepID=A0A2U3DS04_PURLI|nr:hypothetical protein PCL_07453 [Purpureocillium lilacinum]